LPGLAALVQPNHDVEAAILQVERVGVTLTAVADHGDLAALQTPKIGIGIIVNGYWHTFLRIRSRSYRKSVTLHCKVTDFRFSDSRAYCLFYYPRVEPRPARLGLFV